MMKRIVMLALGFAALGTLLYSQDGDSRRRERSDDYTRNRTAPEQLSLTGTLELKQGVIALQSGDQTWYAPGLQRYTGFIEGLKEGAVVTLEGWGQTNPRSGETTGLLRVSKLTLNGKDYDLEGPGISDRRSAPSRPAPYGPRDHRGMGPHRDRHHGR
ncbi:MAG: hypothetical protein LBL56_00405 [Treponema sp.]|nr:hypothetical protein [Treponema sp.]